MDEYVRSKTSSKLSTLATAAWSFLSNVSKRREEKTDELAWQVRPGQRRSRRGDPLQRQRSRPPRKNEKSPIIILNKDILAGFTSRNDKTRLNIGNVYWLSRGKKLYLTWNLIDSILEWCVLSLSFFLGWLKLKTTVCSPRGNIIKSKLWWYFIMMDTVLSDKFGTLGDLSC